VDIGSLYREAKSLCSISVSALILPFRAEICSLGSVHAALGQKKRIFMIKTSLNEEPNKILAVKVAENSYMLNMTDVMIYAMETPGAVATAFVEFLKPPALSRVSVTSMWSSTR
jgi:hypothetical protein